MHMMIKNKQQVTLRTTFLSILSNSTLLISKCKHYLVNTKGLLPAKKQTEKIREKKFSYRKGSNSPQTIKNWLRKPSLNSGMETKRVIQKPRFPRIDEYLLDRLDTHHRAW